MGKPTMPATGTDNERFRLEGRSHSFDPRVEAIRADLADVELASRHFAPHYAAAVLRSCIVPRTPVRARPDNDSEMTSELLFGEGFALLDVTGGWAWGYCLHDHYVGYAPAEALGPYVEPTHRLIAASTLSRPDGGTTALPAGAVIAGKVEADMLQGATGAVPADTVAPLYSVADDPVTAAEAMLDVPYLWGGRSNEGIDCSGLMQTMLARAGIDAPRDSDLQLAGLAGDVSASQPYRRGDIVYFVDHVGVMADETNLLHATRHAGKVIREPLAAVVARLEGEGHTPAIVGRKRLLGA